MMEELCNALWRRKTQSMYLEMAHLVNLFLTMAHKSPKWAVIMNSKTNSMQNKPINKRTERNVC